MSSVLSSDNKDAKDTTATDEYEDYDDTDLSNVIIIQQEPNDVKIEKLSTKNKEAKAPETKDANDLQRTDTKKIVEEDENLKIMYDTISFDKHDPKFNLKYSLVELDILRPHEFKYHYELQYKTGTVEIFIVITMYNEDADKLIRTMTGVFENVFQCCRQYKDQKWWEKICICIVSDGREKAEKGNGEGTHMWEYLEKIGIFQRSLLDEQVKKNKHRLKEIAIHLFERTILFDNPLEPNATQIPVQTIYAMKEHNGGKLSSHYWFFRGFSEYLKPKYCFLLDVGTQPNQKALFLLHRAMEENDNVGGCCGEIDIEDGATAFRDPIKASQVFEYKLANYLDKAMESLFGYISVLPGAFSAYRYKAVRVILRDYFEPITNLNLDSIADLNRFLAEDRVLTIELLAVRNKRWIMHLVKDAVATTDCPNTLVDLISQRRRWMNGSFFASTNASWEFFRAMKKSGHPCWHKFGLIMLWFYSILLLLFGFFLIGNFYLAFHGVITFALENDNGDFGKIVALTLKFAYQFTTVSVLCYSLGNAARDSKKVYKMFAIIYGICFFIMVILTFRYVVYSIPAEVRFSALFLPVTYIGVPMLYGIKNFMIVLGSSLWYCCLLPTYVNCFAIFSFSNIHDVSWGTKNISESHVNKDQKAKELKAIRTNFLLMWLGLNWFLILCVTYNNTVMITYFYGLFFVSTGINVFRLISALIYLILEWIKVCRRRRLQKNQVLKKKTNTPSPSSKSKSEIKRVVKKHDNKTVIILSSGKRLKVRQAKSMSNSLSMSSLSSSPQPPPPVHPPPSSSSIHSLPSVGSSISLSSQPLAPPASHASPPSHASPSSPPSHASPSSPPSHASPSSHAPPSSQVSQAPQPPPRPTSPTLTPVSTPVLAPVLAPASSISGYYVSSVSSPSASTSSSSLASTSSSLASTSSSSLASTSSSSLASTSSSSSASTSSSSASASSMPILASSDSTSSSFTSSAISVGEGKYSNGDRPLLPSPSQSTPTQKPLDLNQSSSSLAVKVSVNPQSSSATQHQDHRSNSHSLSASSLHAQFHSHDNTVATDTFTLPPSSFPIMSNNVSSVSLSSQDTPVLPSPILPNVAFTTPIKEISPSSSSPVSTPSPSTPSIDATRVKSNSSSLPSSSSSSVSSTGTETQRPFDIRSAYVEKTMNINSPIPQATASQLQSPTMALSPLLQSNSSSSSNSSPPPMNRPFSFKVSGPKNDPEPNPSNNNGNNNVSQNHLSLTRSSTEPWRNPTSSPRSTANRTPKVMIKKLVEDVHLDLPLNGDEDPIQHFDEAPVIMPPTTNMGTSTGTDAKLMYDHKQMHLSPADRSHENSHDMNMNIPYTGVYSEPQATPLLAQEPFVTVLRDGSASPSPQPSPLASSTSSNSLISLTVNGKSNPIKSQHSGSQTHSPHESPRQNTPPTPDKDNAPSSPTSVNSVPSPLPPLAPLQKPVNNSSKKSRANTAYDEPAATKSHNLTLQQPLTPTLHQNTHNLQGSSHSNYQHVSQSGSANDARSSKHVRVQSFSGVSRRASFSNQRSLIDTFNGLEFGGHEEEPADLQHEVLNGNSPPVAIGFQQHRNSQLPHGKKVNVKPVVTTAQPASVLPNSMQADYNYSQQSNAQQNEYMYSQPNGVQSMLYEAGMDSGSGSIVVVNDSNEESVYYEQQQLHPSTVQSTMAQQTIPKITYATPQIVLPSQSSSTSRIGTPTLSVQPSPDHSPKQTPPKPTQRTRPSSQMDYRSGQTLSRT